MVHTVLITGASRGLGAELCRVFLKAGMEVIGACPDIAALPKDITDSPMFTPLPLDVRSEDSIEAALNSLSKQPIDVLINNAGIYDSTSVDDDSVVSSIPEISRIFAINAIGPRVFSERLLPNLETGSEKLIVNISSGMGTYLQLFGKGLFEDSRGESSYSAHHWAYSASKTALNYAMLSFSVAHPTIKSVLINPGWMKTKIGGKEAPDDPRTSAEHIFALIRNHKEKLLYGTLTNWNGERMGL